MGTASWVDPSTGWILGWTLFHSLWQGALVAGALALVLRAVPGSMARLRAVAAWGALLLIVALAAGTWLLVDTEWRGHAACWDSESFATENAPLCVGHAVPAARAALGHHAKAEVSPGPLAWVERMALPVPGSVRSLSLDATGAIPLFAMIGGVLVVAAVLRLVIGLRLLGGVVRRARATAYPELEGLLRRLRSELRVTGPVELRESEEISTPAVAGWRRPVVLMPRGMTDVLETEQLADVLAHELVHVRGRHFAVNLAQRALDCLCVFNPFALWISRNIREEREVRCDHVAAGPRSRGRHRYVETLLQLEHLRGPASPAFIGLLGEGCLLRRIRRLVAVPSARRGQVRRTLMALGGALAAVVVVVQVSMTTVALTSWAVMSHDIDVRRTTAAQSVAPASKPARPGGETGLTGGETGPPAIVTSPYGSLIEL